MLWLVVIFLQSPVISKYSSHLFVFYNIDFLEECGCLTAFSWLDAVCAFGQGCRVSAAAASLVPSSRGTGCHLAPLLVMLTLVTRLMWSLPKFTFFPLKLISALLINARCFETVFPPINSCPIVLASTADSLLYQQLLWQLRNGVDAFQHLESVAIYYLISQIKPLGLWR